MGYWNDIKNWFLRHEEMSDKNVIKCLQVENEKLNNELKRAWEGMGIWQKRYEDAAPICKEVLKLQEQVKRLTTVENQLTAAQETIKNLTDALWQTNQYMSCAVDAMHARMKHNRQYIGKPVDFISVNSHSLDELKEAYIAGKVFKYDAYTAKKPLGNYEYAIQIDVDQQEGNNVYRRFGNDWYLTNLWIGNEMLAEWNYEREHSVKPT